ncbi:hypothetical protein POSPLADRAFT_1131087 [Postia placenta MAD-698-R-SB12]|uniref:F-box domain-containing protein n=1 Tax=Postia placenta MAD-698-R-SB12 TaxID=670580 RepID=A0A1X6NAN8_9APHY|nr:hypothetical protein POSPLADRAFT_1131087 [Postia placenta MAD-698-R-SB12]OSX65707.1 hypothetical protein POSPLADRAFT_1131087 [Postia placenta MAD-698-R-SB12]
MAVTLTFDRDTAMVRQAMLPRLPVEIWLLIIDELGAEGEYDALMACAGASDGLMNERARSYVPFQMSFRTPEEVASINLRQRWKGPYAVRILGGMRRGERLPIPHLATFASRLAQRWTVPELTIENAEWRARDLDPRSVLLDLACFNEIRHLHLAGVTFPTVLTFWRLICALPHLDNLYLYDVEIVKTAANVHTALCLLPASQIRCIHLPTPPPTKPVVGRPQSFARHSVPLLEQSMSPLKTPPWRNVHKLILWDVTLPTAEAFARVLVALPALMTLVINGPCTFSEHGFNPSDVPLRPDMLKKLTTVELGKSFSLFSDPQSVHDLVDIFVQSGASGHLTEIMAWLYQSLHVATSIDVALNRLVKHAGQLLRKLNLRVLSQDNSWLCNEVSTYATPSTARCFDISANTYLGYFLYSVEIIHDDDSTISAVVELLHQVTSAHISHVNLIFCVMDEADLAKWWTSLPQLDAALSREVFHMLDTVRIRFFRGNNCREIPVAAVRTWLPGLDARDILRCVPP